MKELSSSERSTLRARAHSLNPVVIIGNGGLTPGVIAEVERSLKAHELIKIRVGGADHAERESICESICAQTTAAPVQHIGKILVIYRKRPEEEVIATAPKKSIVPGGRVGKRPAVRRTAASFSPDPRGARRPRTARD